MGAVLLRDVRVRLHERLRWWWGYLHVGERIRQRAVLRALRARLRTDAPLLDAGCGRGDLAFAVARSGATIVHAWDNDPRMIAQVATRARASGTTAVVPRVADVTRMEGGERYGMLYAVDLLEHVREPASLLVRFADVLLPNGVLVLHVPAFAQRRWFRRFTEYRQEDHEREGFSPEELRIFVERAQLTVCGQLWTFGPPGALAWELFHLLAGFARPLIVVAYPLLAVLMVWDGWGRWRRGNGILLVAEKR